MIPQTKPLISTWKAYSLYAIDSPRRVNFISRFMLDDKKAAYKSVRKLCKKALGRSPNELEMKTAQTAISKTLSDFEPASKDSLTQFGRKFVNYFALSCSVVSVSLIALSVRAAKTAGLDIESIAYLGLAALYPTLPAIASGVESFKNWKNTYQDLARQLDSTIRSALQQ